MKSCLFDIVTESVFKWWSAEYTIHLDFGKLGGYSTAHIQHQSSATLKHKVPLELEVV